MAAWPWSSSAGNPITRCCVPRCLSLAETLQERTFLCLLACRLRAHFHADIILLAFCISLGQFDSALSWVALQGPLPLITLGSAAPCTWEAEAALGRAKLFLMGSPYASDFCFSEVVGGPLQVRPGSDLVQDLTSAEACASPAALLPSTRRRVLAKHPELFVASEALQP